MPRDLWRWLVKCGAVASVRAQKNSSGQGVIRVDQQTQAAIEAGIALSKALGAADPRIIKRLDAIQNNPSYPVARLSNWNLLCGTIKRMGISVSADDKALVIAGDHSMLLEVYQSVYGKMSNKSGYEKNGRGRKQNKKRNAGYDPTATGFEGVSSGGRARGGKGGKKSGPPVTGSDDAEILAVRILEIKVSRSQLEEVEKKSRMQLSNYTSAPSFLLASMVQRLNIRPPHVSH